MDLRLHWLLEESYRGINGLEPGMSAENLVMLASQYLKNRGGFRRYVHEQAFLSLPPLLIRAAQELIPSIKAEHIEMSKSRNRAQLFNRQTNQLENDFICMPGPAALTY